MSLDYEPFRKIFEIIGNDRSNIILINNFIDPEDLKNIQDYLNTHKDDHNFMGGKDLRFDQVLLTPNCS